MALLKQILYDLFNSVYIKRPLTNFLVPLQHTLFAMTTNMIWRAACAFTALFFVSVASEEGWDTCGELSTEDLYNRTACPTSEATCCVRKWYVFQLFFQTFLKTYQNLTFFFFSLTLISPRMPSKGNFGCCPMANATCCANGYTCCPQNHECVDTGSGWSVTTTCKPVQPTSAPETAGYQVCKTGAPLHFSKTLKNVIIMGDSVSIGYAPKVQNALSDIALVQHSPWGGDGGAEETQYGFRCIEFLLRSPSGVKQVPDLLFFNWGLHNVANATIPGQAGPISDYAPYLDKIAARLIKLQPRTKLIFGITTPELCDKNLDGVVQRNNDAARKIMASYGIDTVDMHAAITSKCGEAPQASCFGSAGCFCPHCPAKNGLGYAWLANTTIAPAIRSKLSA